MSGPATEPRDPGHPARAGASGATPPGTGPTGTGPTGTGPAAAGPAGAGPAGGAGRGPSPRRPGDRAPLDRRVALAAVFAGLFCEVQAAVRPRRLLGPFVTPVLQARLSYLRVTAGVPARVLGVTGAAVSPGIYEAVAIVRRNGRCGAVALRLVRTAAGWRVDDVARPEDGPLPQLPFPPDTDDLDGEEGGRSDGADTRCAAGLAPSKQRRVG